MPNFLQSSMDNFQRGWNQMYGGPTAQPAPLARNPAIGAPLGSPGSAPPIPSISAPLMGISIQPPNLGTPLANPDPAVANDPFFNRPAPISSNPAIGAPLSGDQSDGSNAFSSWLSNFFSNILSGGGNRAPQMNSPGLPTNVGIAQPGSDYESSLAGMGPTNQWPTGSTVSPGNYVLGPSTDGGAGQILATGSDATATPGGGGAMGGKGIGSSIGSAIGGALSAFSKQPTMQYQQDNVPLPQRAVFAPPTLPPNTNT